MCEKANRSVDSPNLLEPEIQRHFPADVLATAEAAIAGLKADGKSEAEAATAVSNMLLMAAWIVTSAAKTRSGDEPPSISQFAFAARTIAGRIAWRDGVPVWI